jgi:COMPASS component SWD3
MRRLTHVSALHVQGSAELMQKLEGHSDRVYSCHFNPCKPMLATCSADSVIRASPPRE